MPQQQLIDIDTHRAQETTYWRLLIWSLSLYLFTMRGVTGWAQEGASSTSLRTQLTSPRVSAMSNAGIGGSNSTSALMINPAGMVLDSSYVIDANYLRSSQAQNMFGLNVTDSQTKGGTFALGLAYQTEMTNGDFVQHDGRIGLAMPVFKLAKRQVFGGVSAHYIYQQETKNDHFDMNFGLMSLVTDIFSVGLVGTDLLSDELQRWGVGAGLITRKISAHIDFKHNFDYAYSDVHLGAEAMISSNLVLRGGYVHNFKDEESEPNLFSVGLAILKLGQGRGRVNLSYNQSLTRDEHIIAVGFSTYLEARDAR